MFFNVFLTSSLRSFTAILEVTGQGELPMWHYIFWIQTGLGWVGGAAGLTGVLLTIILAVMVVFSLPCVRRKGFFEVFYWTHNLFILWYILLILHATHFWKWFLVPGLAYIIEMILRSKVIKLARYGRTYVQEGILLPSKVARVWLCTLISLCLILISVYSSRFVTFVKKFTNITAIFMVTKNGCNNLRVI